MRLLTFAPFAPTYSILFVVHWRPNKTQPMVKVKLDECRVSEQEPNGRQVMTECLWAGKESEW